MGELVSGWCITILEQAKLFADFEPGCRLSESEAEKRAEESADNLPKIHLTRRNLEALRISQAKQREGTKNQLYKWVHRKFITYCSQTGLYIMKTQEYLTGTPEAKEKK